MRDSRVLVFSQRNVHSPTWHTAQYEFEDLVLAWEDATLLAPPGIDPPWLSSLSRHVVNGAAHHLRLPRRSPPWVHASMAPSAVTTSHELFMAVFHHAYQLSYLHRLKGWRERTGKAVALLVEQWSPEVADNRDFLRLLEQFDAVYVQNPAMVEHLQSLGLAAPTYFAPALDARLFAPVPHAPARVLDVYNYGRTAPASHQALLRLVETKGLNYLYDTLGDASVRQPPEHRALLANMMQRSKFFLAFRINDSPERRLITGGDEVLPTRYVEGVAGGAVVLGTPTPSAEFQANFDWPDAVIPLAYDDDSVETLLEELSAQPERLSAVRTANVRNSLLRHDWVYRWQHMLSEVGLPTSPRVRDRISSLADLARSVDLAPEPVVLRRPAQGAARGPGLPRSA